MKAFVHAVFLERFMKHPLLATVLISILFASIVSLLVAEWGVASAADLPVKAHPKAPPLVAQAYDWIGFYIGGFASENSGSPKMSGGLTGGTIGYNWQISNVVFGLEADGGWADVSAAASALGITAKSK